MPADVPHERGEARVTLTMQGLKLLPLPIGLRSRLVRGERIELS